MPSEWFVEASTDAFLALREWNAWVAGPCRYVPNFHCGPRPSAFEVTPVFVGAVGIVRSSAASEQDPGLPGEDLAGKGMPPDSS